MRSLIEIGIEKAGGLTKAAALLGIKPPSLCGWRDRGSVPAERVLDFERVTGIPRHELRPDIYPPAEPQEAA